MLDKLTHYFLIVTYIMLRLVTMLQAYTQAVDFKVGHHFGEGQAWLLQPEPIPVSVDPTITAKLADCCCD